jgi:DNA-binding CsgD family transcriptional regulator
MKKQATTETLETLVGRLSPVEREIYLWLRESFSIPWIAETTMRGKREIKGIAARVYKTLEVSGQTELVACYGTLGKETPGEATDIRTEKLANDLALYNKKMQGEAGA